MSKNDDFYEGYKRIYADDLALAEGFEWDYENASDDEVYDTLEAMGYTWDGSHWRPPDYVPPTPVGSMPPRRRKPIDLQSQLQAWNEGKPLPGGMGEATQ